VNSESIKELDDFKMHSEVVFLAVDSIVQLCYKIKGGRITKIDLDYLSSDHMRVLGNLFAAINSGNCSLEINDFDSISRSYHQLSQEHKRLLMVSEKMGTIMKYCSPISPGK